MFYLDLLTKHHITDLSFTLVWDEEFRRSMDSTLIFYDVIEDPIEVRKKQIV